MSLWSSVHTEVEMFDLEDLLKKGDYDLAGLGQRFSHSHICFNSLKGSGKMPGGIKGTSQLAYIKPLPLT